MSKLRAGDIVRIKGRSKEGGYSHGFKSGQLVAVVVEHDHGGLVDVVGAHTAGCYPTGNRIRQTVAVTHLKLAKQAMRKRAQYAARRGGDPFEIPA